MIDEVNLPLLYKSKVPPFLEYGKSVWGPSGRVDQATGKTGTSAVDDHQDGFEDQVGRRGDTIIVLQLLHSEISVQPSGSCAPASPIRQVATSGN